MLISWWLPGDGPHPIEATQPKFRAQPEITVGCLGNRLYLAPYEAVADLPCSVCVLADVERWI